MSRLRALIPLLCVGIVTWSSVHAQVVFNDTFVAADGTLLDGRSPVTGSAWNVTEGASQLVISGGSVDTSNVSPGLTLAFGGFTQSLSAGKILTLTFNTLTPSSGNFATMGWAGISLYTGGSNGNERFFVGSPGEIESWGIHGSAVDRTGMPGVTSPAQSVSFSYNYDTGAWQYSVGTNSLSGSTTTGLALDTLRIGADIDNRADINVSDVTVEITAIPEPSTYALLCLGAAGVGYLRWRQRRK
jgi:hypothetical protein